MKYLIWAVVIYFAWRWYLVSKEKSAAADRRDDGAAGAGSRTASQAEFAAESAATRAEGATEKMVACAHCRIHLPLSEALTGTDQRYYCSEAHRAQHSAS